jgi:hypothetical protein
MKTAGRDKTKEYTREQETSKAWLAEVSSGVIDLTALFHNKFF